MRAAIGRALAAERTATGLSQREFGRRMGWSQQTVSAIESGVRPFYADDFPPVCKILGCTPLDLLRRGNASERADMGI